MRFFKNELLRIKAFFLPRFKVITIEDLPEKLLNKTIYIVGNKNEPWSIAFNCPCGCKDIIHLNLIKDAHPRWKFKVSEDRINITPSIWRISGCKSHFLIRNGKTVWL